MKHEERHAIGMWLITALLGGFALLAWVTGRLGGGDSSPDLRPPLQPSDSAGSAEAAVIPRSPAQRTSSGARSINQV